jgi:Fe-S cluster assembly protein SufD
MSVHALENNVFPESFAPESADPVRSRCAWLEERRARAMQGLRAGGIPHRRVEEWKYTDLRNALEARRGDAGGVIAFPARDPFAAIAGARLVFGDGAIDSSSILPADGVELANLATLGDDAPEWIRQNLGRVLSNGMGQASLALMRGGAAIRVRRGTNAQVHLRFSQRAETVHSRVLVEVEDGASLLLLESHGVADGLSNLGVEILLRPNARMTHVGLADSAPDAVRIGEIGIRMARDAHYVGHFPQAGARLSRLEIAMKLEGEGAGAALYGAGVLGGKLHADVTTHIEHVAGNTASTQLFKYIAGGHSRAIYQGKISVHKGADGSDSRQTAKAILTGERAEADLKPELEILADDVKCAHGAAVGDLDADSLFYLRARGIPKGEARELLVRAFLEETVVEIAREDIRESVWNFVENSLPRALEAAA